MKKKLDEIRKYVAKLIFPADPPPSDVKEEISREDQFFARPVARVWGGIKFFRGTSEMDGEEWTVGEAAECEAASRVDAIQSQLSTTVCPATGYHMVWAMPHMTEGKQVYQNRVRAACREELVRRGMPTAIASRII